MRFMRFSKDSLSMRFSALVLVGALGLFGVLASPGEADAAKFVYTVKFNCQASIVEGAFSSLVENSIINIHNPNDETVRFNKKVVLGVRNTEYGQFKSSFKGKNISKKFGEELLPNDAIFVDCNEILRGFDFFFPYFFVTLETDEDLLFKFHVPFPFQFHAFLVEFDLLELVSLDGVVVIETARRRGKRRDVVVSVKYWKTFETLTRINPGFTGAGASIEVEHNIQPVVINGTFKLAPPPPPLELP